jgi:hypothetical protein
MFYPILQKIRSLISVVKLLAGTNAPIYAKITARHVYRNKVDFPPILGPVTSIAITPFSNTVSFGMSYFFLSFSN